MDGTFVTFWIILYNSPGDVVFRALERERIGRGYGRIIVGYVGEFNI